MNCMRERVSKSVSRTAPSINTSACFPYRPRGGVGVEEFRACPDSSVDLGTYLV